MTIPTKPGFYWAKWRIPDDDTHEKDLINFRVMDWEVVEVFENCINETDIEYLRVFVGGVRETQSLENFFWGEGPIKEPI